MNRKLVAAVVSVGMLALVPSVSQATPGNGAASITHSFSCDGQALTFVIAGGPGNFSTAYVVETGKTFVPTSFTFNGTLLAAKAGPASARSGHLHGDATGRHAGGDGLLRASHGLGPGPL